VEGTDAAVEEALRSGGWHEKVMEFTARQVAENVNLLKLTAEELIHKIELEERSIRFWEPQNGSHHAIAAAEKADLINAAQRIR